MKIKKTLYFFLALSIVISCKNDILDFGLDEIDGSLDRKAYMEIPGLRTHQSMDFHEEKGVFIMPLDNVLVCDVYDLTSKELLSSLSLPFESYPIPHANTSCFGKVFFSHESVFPALYVSSWNNGRQAFVYDISNSDGSSYACSLIQVIDPSNVCEDIIGGGYLDWVVEDDSFIYSLSYHVRGSSRVSEGNFIHVTKFILPPLSEKRIMLTDADVVESFFLPVITVFQDKCFNRGHLFIVAGIPDETGLFPPRMFDIDVALRRMTEIKLPLSGEPEGFCFYKGRRWLNMYGSNKIYSMERLLDSY